MYINMYQETPNKKEIGWITKQFREIYDYEKLKGCDIDYLYNLEYGLETHLTLFKNRFPSEEGLEGNLRAYVTDNPNANRESLTEAEKMRLQMLEEEIKRNIRRARGHRVEQRQKHRGRLANTIADVISGLAKLARG